MKKCSNCGTISDSKFCPDCGTKLETFEESKDVSLDENNQIIPEGNTSPHSEKLEEARISEPPGGKTVISDHVETDFSHTNVNANIENVLPPKKKNAKKIILIVGVFVALLAVVVVAMSVKAANDQKAAEEAALKEYNDGVLWMRVEAATMYDKVNDVYGSGIQSCEQLVNLTNNVWHDAIFDESSKHTKKYLKGSGGDFNKAIEKLYASKKVKKLHTELHSIEEEAKDTSKLPNSLSDVQDKYVAVVIAYQDVVSWCDWPNGSYQTYMQESQPKFDEFNKAYNEFDIACPKAKDLTSVESEGAN